MNIKTRFTLAELIVVSIIIVITFVMLSLGTMRLSKAREDARRISCASSLKSLGLAIRMYSQEYKEQFPYRPGRAGLEMLRSGGYCENVKMYTCPSTTDSITDGYGLISSSVSYKYAGGLDESTSVDSGVMIDRESNHRKYGNILFCDGHAAGFTGAKWALDNSGGSNFSW